MKATSSRILSGPEEDSQIPKQTLGKLIFDCLQTRPSQDVINIDALTGEVLTCETLLNKTVKLSFVFKEMGLIKGDVIAIVSENCLNYVVPVASAFYLGLVVNPLNSAYTIGELKSALAISKPKLILCSEKSYEAVFQVAEDLKIDSILLIEHSKKACVNGIQCFESLLKDVATNVNQFEVEQYDFSHDALIMASSGTTGHPKGVLLTHENIRSALLPMCNPSHAAYTSEDTTVVVLPFFHLFGLLHEFNAIIIGIKVVIMDGFNPELYLKSIQDYKATILVVVPPLVQFLIKNPLVNKYDISGVKDILCGGAPLDSRMENEFQKRFPNLKVRQMYGLSEVSGMCTAVPRSSVNRKGTVGILIENALAKVVNIETNKTVCAREVGEICFKGPMVMKAYFCNPDATKESFDTEGFLRTGDLGYYDEDEYFYIVDRLKEIIKYKGFQVPPAELEALLLSHPSVKDCGVIGVPDERAGQVPLAFVVLKDNSTATEEELINFVAERISVTKHLYGGVRFIEEIPKSQSGKILRRKLTDIYKCSC